MQDLLSASARIEVISCLVMISLTFSVGCSRAPEPQTITVCDLLGNVDTHRGKRVAVRGIYFGSLQQACPEPFRVGPRTYASALNLRVSVMNSNDSLPQFTDPKSWGEFERLIHREGQAGHREEIWVTMIGKLEAARLRDDGKVVGGYGHLGVLGGELAVERVLDIELTPEPTFDYGRFAGPAFAQ